MKKCHSCGSVFKVKKKINLDTYSVAKANSFSDRSIQKARQRMYRVLAESVDLEKVQTVLDVGATADRTQISANFFENTYPYPERVTALSNQDASWMEEAYEGLKFQQGTALDMPFKDGEFELVFSSAVIEHVGSYENQMRFISECMRVSQKYIFITTPNRKYPLELHTALPLIHWLPKGVHRKILQAIGRSFFAVEENLNLLTKGDLEKICKEIGTSKYTIRTINFLGFPSNLLLTIEK
jgi:cyclopropane fatty-acyl-phospholipid synthase-like methyltransferase